MWFAPSHMRLGAAVLMTVLTRPGCSSSPRRLESHWSSSSLGKNGGTSASFFCASFITNAECQFGRSNYKNTCDVEVEWWLLQLRQGGFIQSCAFKSSLLLPSSSLTGLPAVMSWLFLDWFVPLYLLVSVLVLAGFGVCLYFLEPGLQDGHRWSNKAIRHHPLVASVNCRDDDDSNALIWWRR